MSALERPQARRTLLVAVAFGLGMVLGMVTAPSRVKAQERVVRVERAGQPIFFPSRLPDAAGFSQARPMRTPEAPMLMPRRPEPARFGFERPGQGMGERGFGRFEREALSPWQMRDLLRAQGFARADFSRQRGQLIRATAFDRRGLPVRLSIDMFTGRVVAVSRLDPGTGGWWGGRY